ncbi:hypothetical protein CWI38_0207p0040 [Hamiltosporidium tvaerminnensis]|uniref:RRM domain-containing protein n=1 Tax=Hamiltosporidium tvaerminnensis TaxID=1176355 RepID=A0A4Q9LZM1_9MICR|nr:hypothetical protein CWI38_0207p0040 [Hamiltosporidium tvaerminnensis]
MKRPYQEETVIEDKSTRTVLITNLENAEQIKPFYKDLPVKEVYTIKENQNILFIIFYDLRNAELFFQRCSTLPFPAVPIYTVSKYEIPRESDKCDEGKNQSTILITNKDNNTLSEEEVSKMCSIFGEIKAVREYRHNQKFVEFYDSRSALEAFKKINEKNSNNNLNLRFVWDNSVKARWDYINNTDRVLKSFQENKYKNEIVKRKKLSKEEEITKKKNFYIGLFDDFIIQNINEIEKMLK